MKNNKKSMEVWTFHSTDKLTIEALLPPVRTLIRVRVRTIEALLPPVGTPCYEKGVRHGGIRARIKCQESVEVGQSRARRE